MGKFWSQPLRVECDMSQLVTSKTINSRLWFVYNPRFEQRVKAFLAKYQKKYGVLIYAFVIVGNHYHLVCEFPNGNRSAFFRDFNARVAEAVRMYVKEFIGGPVFQRRFTPQALPLDADREQYFFYCALQAVSSGLTQRISEYPCYNSFTTAIGKGRERLVLFNYGAYNAAKRFNPLVSKKNYYEEHVLQYSRLPNLAHLSQEAYRKYLLDELERRRVALVAERVAEGKGFLGPELLEQVEPGSLPFSTKKGGMRPLVLSCCKEARGNFLEQYFGVVAAYRQASLRYRQGEFDAVFPPGTFRPNGMCMLQ